MKRCSLRVIMSVLVMCMLLAGSGSIKTEAANLGTAHFIGGKTILVSIFTNTSKYSWDFDNPDDFQTYSSLYHQLQTAAEWIEEQTAAWNVWSDIEWDWYNNKDLYYVADLPNVNEEYIDSRYPETLDWFESHIDVDALTARYNADNIIFMWYINTDLYHDEHCHAFQFDYKGLTDNQKGYEGVWFNVHMSGYTKGASAMAHEILHCFGAVDLYRSSDQIPQSYVDHLKSIGSTDIMYMIYDRPDKITETFTELDAYYVGLTPNSHDAQVYGLGKSPHLQ